MILYRYFLRTTVFQGNITFHLFLLYIVLMILYRYFLRTTFFQGNITFHLFLLYIVLIILYRYFLRTTFFTLKHNFPSLPLIHCPHDSLWVFYTDYFFLGNISFHLFLLYIVLMILYRYFLRTTFFTLKHNFPSLPLIHCPHDSL